MQTVNKKWKKYSLCKHPTQNVLERKFLIDSIKEWVVDMCSEFPSKIPNSNLYAIYNFGLYVSICTLTCENTLLLSCMDEEEKCLSKGR